MNLSPLASAMCDAGLMWPHVVHRRQFTSWHVVLPALHSHGFLMLWERR